MLLLPFNNGQKGDHAILGAQEFTLSQTSLTGVKGQLDQSLTGDLRATRRKFHPKLQGDQAGGIIQMIFFPL